MADITDRLLEAKENPESIYSDPELHQVCSEAAEEIRKLRDIITQAIPFIGTAANVPILIEKAEAAVNYPFGAKSLIKRRAKE